MDRSRTVSVTPERRPDCRVREKGRVCGITDSPTSLGKMRFCNPVLLTKTIFDAHGASQKGRPEASDHSQGRGATSGTHSWNGLRSAQRFPVRSFDSARNEESNS